MSQRPVSIVEESFVDGKNVSGLSFRRLSFVASGGDPTDAWYLFDQCCSNSVQKQFRQGLIFLENATDIEFSGCRIQAAADTGIWLNHATAKINITGNWIEDADYCGIFAYGFWPGDPKSYWNGPNTTATDTYVNKQHTIDSNVIRNVGTRNAGAAGIWLFQSGENYIKSNYINRGPRNSVGLFGPHYVAMSTVNYTRGTGLPRRQHSPVMTTACTTSESGPLRISSLSATHVTQSSVTTFQTWFEIRWILDALKAMGWARDRK